MCRQIAADSMSCPSSVSNTGTRPERMTRAVLVEQTVLLRHDDVVVRRADLLERPPDTGRASRALALEEAMHRVRIRGSSERAGDRGDVLGRRAAAAADDARAAVDVAADVLGEHLRVGVVDDGVADDRAGRRRSA